MKSIGHADLHHQFILSPTGSILVDGWRRHDSGGYCLWAHPSLPVHGVLDKDGNEVGYALGWPIDESGRLVQAQLRLPFHVSENTTDSLEKVIYAFGGRYAFVVLAPAIKRLYLDAGGTLSAVYSARRQMAGATLAALVMDEPNHPLWSRPLGEFPDNKPDQFWPAGTTLDPRINRLLPNHYLDLHRWRAVRHYPRSRLEAIPAKGVPDAIENIVTLLRSDIRAILESPQRLYMPLTAGRDSRMMLACSRAWRDRIEYVTFDYSPWRRKRGEQVDLYVALRLASRFGLRHLVLPVSANPPAGTQLQYLHRTGFSGGAGKSWDFFTTCREHLDLSAAWLTGFAGAVGRAFFSKPSDDESHRMSGAELLHRMNLPPLHRLQEALGDWLDELPDLPLSTLLELAFVELRLGCWAAPHFYGAAPFSINLAPFSHREIFDILIRLPAAYRRNKVAATDIISTTWPELLGLPFNEYPGLRGMIGPSSWIGRSKRRVRSTLKRLLIPG
jgi:hypothetical protein